jgi:hypothetical protein
MAVMSDDADVGDDPSHMNDNNSHHVSIICANDLVGWMFLMDPREDGRQHHAHIVEFLQDHKHDLKMSDDHHKFRISVYNDGYKEIIMYNELMDFIAKQNDENEDIIRKSQHMVGHQGPLIHIDPNYKGSKYNMLMKGRMGRLPNNPWPSLQLMIPAPITCAIYVKEKGLLDKERWKHLKRLLIRRSTSSD